MEIRDNERLAFHLKEVLNGNRKFENAAQSVSRMILEKGIEKLARAGRTVFEFKFFREGREHIIGWHEEITELVNFVKDAAEGGSSKRLAFVLVGEPGNGKTFVVQYVCDRYIEFLNQPGNGRYTFEFVNLDKESLREIYGETKTVRSQTLEDPIVLAMNLFESTSENCDSLSKAGFDDSTINRLYRNYRALAPCTLRIWNDIREYCNGDIEKMLQFVRIVRVRSAPNMGIITTKYSAADKITASAEDLRGDEELRRVLKLPDSTHPYNYDVSKGALARSGGGGIHFSDELFKNKADLINIYLQAINNRTVELKGYLWPLDVLIIATSNNAEYNTFVSQKEQGPIKDRCRICYVSHNTDYKLQHELTRYAIGSEEKIAVTGENLHEDPNLVYALSVAVVLTRLPHSDKLTPIEMMKLVAGETAGEKNVKTLREIMEGLNTNSDVTKRWGQKGVGHRGLGRIVQIMLSMPETHEGKCLFARDCFKAAEREVLDYITEAVDREKFMKDLELARKLYRREIKTSIFNAYRDDPEAIRKDVLAYVNMLIGVISEKLGPDKMWRYIDPQTGEQKAIKIDETYMDSVEKRLGITTKEMRETHRNTIYKIYAQKRSTDPNYDFTDNENLVKAVTEVRLESDVAGAASLVGALANQTNEENVRIKSKMLTTMRGTLGYCNTCALKTMEYFCEKVDED